MKYDLKEPKYFVGQTVNYLHHNKNMLVGRIVSVQTSYSKREYATIGYHIYGILNEGNKRAFWIGEQYIDSVVA